MGLERMTEGNVGENLMGNRMYRIELAGVEVLAFNRQILSIYYVF